MAELWVREEDITEWAQSLDWDANWILVPDGIATKMQLPIRPGSRHGLLDDESGEKIEYITSHYDDEANGWILVKFP